jgi:hypothetical protein
MAVGELVNNLKRKLRFFSTRRFFLKFCAASYELWHDGCVKRFMYEPLIGRRL